MVLFLCFLIAFLCFVYFGLLHGSLITFICLACVGLLRGYLIVLLVRLIGGDYSDERTN